MPNCQWAQNQLFGLAPISVIQVDPDASPERTFSRRATEGACRASHFGRSGPSTTRHLSISRALRPRTSSLVSPAEGHRRAVGVDEQPQSSASRHLSRPLDPLDPLYGLWEIGARRASEVAFVGAIERRLRIVVYAAADFAHGRGAGAEHIGSHRETKPLGVAERRFTDTGREHGAAPCSRRNARPATAPGVKVGPGNASSADRAPSPRQSRSRPSAASDPRRRPCSSISAARCR
jgi:hypothetical protein